MPLNQTNIYLAEWQLAFVEQFILDNKRRSRLIANAGMGKTTTVRYAAHEVLQRQLNNYVLVISHHLALAEFWRRSTGRNEPIWGASIQDLQTGRATGLSVSSHNLHTSDLGREILALGSKSSFFVVLEEVHDAYPAIHKYIDQLLAANKQSRMLGLFTLHQETRFNSWSFDTDAEYFFPSTISLPESRIEIARLSPSHSVLQSLLLRPGGA